jgi:hypothetical protein
MDSKESRRPEGEAAGQAGKATPGDSGPAEEQNDTEAHTLSLDPGTAQQLSRARTEDVARESRVRQLRKSLRLSRGDRQR